MNSADPRVAYFSYALDRGEHVGSLPDVFHMEERVKLVAFYLPQFHPIAENNKAWGKNFTEWTNVTRAVPQFAGHYQPHLPAHLGFYDLRVPEVQEEQVMLAKRAGLSAFCFHFYWFNGHRVLETPIKNFAESENIDFEFCLCWANENWTKRWDGQENDIILKQEYGADDDMEFIKYISTYLKNDKYLRVNGKPLLIVYRPALLPDMKRTAERWRDWCREQGIGEIHIAYAQTFEKVDPKKYGLDSGVQFPPNDTRWREDTLASYKDPLDLFNPDYKGEVYDYQDLVDKAGKFERPSYPVFRGVCPGWDNEARRPGQGKTVVNSSPQSYRQYLEFVISEVESYAPRDEESLVFINAWNEWAEGAHLEPDRKYGMAFLEATRMALLRASLPRMAPAVQGKIAVVVHAFYPDIFAEMLDELKEIKQEHDFFISTTPENEAIIRDILRRRGVEAYIFSCQNRGRDIAPFLDILRTISPAEHPFLLKLHTKRSMHIKDGDVWRRQILSSIGTSESIESCMRIFNEKTRLGVLGPCDHLLAMRSFLNRNEQAVRNLATRMGVAEIAAPEDAFIAGSMFLARTAALLPLSYLGISVDDFEEEGGQVNGTLAHAIERGITYSAHVAGLSVASLSKPDTGASGGLNFEGATTYAFAQATP